MRYTNILFLSVLFFIHQITFASSFHNAPPLNFEATNRLPTIIMCDTLNSSLTELNRPSPLLHIFRKNQKNNKQTVAALLAFPLPFGIVGLHRIYLGTAPYVPVAYIASLGGMFGILPFVDFCVLLLNKDTESYVNNRKIFMWVN